MDNDGQNDGHSDALNDCHQESQGYRRIELITGTPGIRRRSAKERAQILTESFEPGANISAVARRHGVNIGLLHYWRKRAKALASGTMKADAPTFVPISIADSKDNVPLRPSAGRMIEIETGGTIVRVPTGVDGKTLALVLAAVRRGP
jgi:transposase